jgi:hypothetical protein
MHNIVRMTALFTLCMLICLPFLYTEMCLVFAEYKLMYVYNKTMNKHFHY